MVPIFGCFGGCNTKKVEELWVSEWVLPIHDNLVKLSNEAGSFAKCQVNMTK